MEEILIGKKLDHYKMSFSIYTQLGWCYLYHLGGGTKAVCS